MSPNVYFFSVPYIHSDKLVEFSVIAFLRFKTYFKNITRPSPVYHHTTPLRLKKKTVSFINFSMSFDLIIRNNILTSPKTTYYYTFFSAYLLILIQMRRKYLCKHTYIDTQMCSSKKF